MTIPDALREHAINCRFLGDVESCIVNDVFVTWNDIPRIVRVPRIVRFGYTTQWRVYCLLVAEALAA